jgi:hypothetical protein
VEIHNCARRGLVLSFYLSPDHESIWHSPEDEAPLRETHLRRWCRQSSGTHTDFTWLMSSQRVANLALGMISLSSYRSSWKFLLLVKMTQGDIFDSRWQCQTSFCQNRDSVFGSEFPTPSSSLSWFARSRSLRLLAFRASERSASRELIRWTWWTLVSYPENFELSRLWDFRCGISRMVDLIAKCIDGNDKYVGWCLNRNVQLLF